MERESDSEKVRRWAKKLFSARGMMVILFILIVAVLAYTLFIYAKPCTSFECFKAGMEKCDKVSYVNDATESTWGYKVLGKSGGNCVVNVKLLQAKEGELKIDQLTGYSMECSYPSGIGTYPEKDLSKCHGRLKEELQALVIEKLHINILENLKEIQAGVAGAK